MPTLTSNEAMREPSRQASVRPRLWGRSDYIAEVFDGSDEALAALETVQGGLISTGFQSLNWLIVLFEELAPAQGAEPRVIVVTQRSTGEVALVLPLLIESKGRLRTARLADLGVSDYGAPILGRSAPVDARAMRRIWRAVRSALRDADLICIERMPPNIGQSANPLLLLRGVTPARQAGNLIVIDDTVDAFIESRGKKFRKEAARCMRLLEKAGPPKFYRAEAPVDIARVFTALDEQQAARHATLDTMYVLDRPEYRAFYERIVMDGSDAGLSYLFALEAGDEIVATLFGIVHDGVFTLLRIANAGEKWSHLSPGRLVILEAMRYLAGRGIKRIDMGIGTYRFKADFGATAIALFDLIEASRLAGAPRALYLRTKNRLRAHPGLQGFRQRLRQRES